MMIRREIGPREFLQKRYEVALRIMEALLSHEKHEDTFHTEKGKRHFLYTCVKSAESFLKESGYVLKSKIDDSGEDSISQTE